MSYAGVILRCSPRGGGTCARKFVGAVGVSLTEAVIRADGMGWQVLHEGRGEEYRCPDHADPVVANAPPVAPRLRLLCPYGCGGAVWTHDDGAQCCDDEAHGAPGCGATWDAVGYPQSLPSTWPPRVVNADRRSWR